MLKKMDFDPKTYPPAPGRWKIIGCHWVKKIDNDLSGDASSFWFNDEKLINFSVTPTIEVEFV